MPPPAAGRIRSGHARSQVAQTNGAARQASPPDRRSARPLPPPNPRGRTITAATLARITTQATTTGQRERRGAWGDSYQRKLSLGGRVTRTSYVAWAARPCFAAIAALQSRAGRPCHEILHRLLLLRRRRLNLITRRLLPRR